MIRKRTQFLREMNSLESIGMYPSRLGSKDFGSVRDRSEIVFVTTPQQSTRRFLPDTQDSRELKDIKKSASKLPFNVENVHKYRMASPTSSRSKSPTAKNNLQIDETNIQDLIKKIEDGYESLDQRENMSKSSQMIINSPIRMSHSVQNGEESHENSNENLL